MALTATTARRLARRVLAETCFTDVRARKFLGVWCVDVDGGSGACYGRTYRTVEGVEECIRVHAREADQEVARGCGEKQ